jgi:hypothetical protein
MTPKIPDRREHQGEKSEQRQLTTQAFFSEKRLAKS